MNDQDEMFEAATETPAFMGCPSLGPKTLPSGFDGVEPAKAKVSDESKAKLEAAVARQREVLTQIADLALAAEAKSGNANVKLGSKFLDNTKAICAIRQLCGPDLVEKSQSEIQREEARQKRVIHWKAYPTKVDVCVMGKTEQNGKVYEVRIAKRGDSKVQDTYGQCKVNGKTVITCSFTGNAWMLKRILTAGMQALVNYKAKKNRDSRRNYAKRAAAAKAKEVK